MQPHSTNALVTVLQDLIVELCRRDAADLTARQLGVFLTCYLAQEGQTVRGLAAHLNISKPAITRALDKLEMLDLARRRVEPMDRRSILVARTVKGAAFLRELKHLMATSAATLGLEPAQAG